MFPIIDTIIKPVMGVIDKLVPDKNLANKLKAQIASMDYSQAEAELKAKAEVIASEARSEHWITSAWRPIIMLLFGAIIANNYIIYPYIRLFWPEAPMLQTPPQMWGLLKLGIGGYIVGRSVEKTAKYIKQKFTE